MENRRSRNLSKVRYSPAGADRLVSTDCAEKGMGFCNQPGMGTPRRPARQISPHSSTVRNLSKVSYPPRSRNASANESDQAATYWRAADQMAPAARIQLKFSAIPNKNAKADRLTPSAVSDAQSILFETSQIKDW